MARLNNLPTEALDALLATDKMSVAGVEFTMGQSAKIPVDKHHRTLLIGLGGTGINTIEYVKGAIKGSLEDNWDKYVAFLGIDTDSNVLKSKTHIQSDEYINITRSSLKDLIDRIKQAGGSANVSSASWPTAWHRFAERKVLQSIADPDGDGAGRKRFLGKAKLHYKDPVSALGVDEEIVLKLSQIISNFNPPTGNGKVQVYVIGSIYGGTGSGTFLEIPALIKRATSLPHAVNAMLYLPDTIIQKYSDVQNDFMANGYASLKELNYFQGLSMRPGYGETWSINDRNNSEITITDNFFTMPYLIGTPNGGTIDSIDEAQKSVAEFFVSTLGNMQSPGQDVFLMDSFMNNAHGLRSLKDDTLDASGEEVMPGSAHEFPRHFCTLGFARAATPMKSITAYAISESCNRAGFLPVSDEDLAAIKSREGAIVPFLSEKQTYQPDDGMRIARSLIKPLEDFIFTLSQPIVEEDRLFTAAVTPDNIRNNVCYDAQTERGIQNYIATFTNDSSIDARKQEMQRAITAVKENIKAYVKKDGPHAFWNIYQGIYNTVQGVENIGMNEMIRRLCYGVDIASGQPIVINIPALKKKFEDANSDVNSNGGLIGIIGDLFTGNDKSLATAWSGAKVNLTKAQIVASLDERFKGPNKILERECRAVLQSIAEQVHSFGAVLDCLSRGYNRHAGDMQNMNTFRAAGGGTDVNVAALDQKAFNWVKAQADESAKKVDAQKIRNAIIDDFFADPDAWLVIDDASIRTVGETYGLVNPDRPAGARVRFDSCISTYVEQQTIDVSFDALFNALKTSGVSYEQYAENIVEELITQSKPRINAKLNCPTFIYMMYPAAMEMGDTIEIVNALKSAAKTKLPNVGINFYKSDYNDGITMYQLKAPFEIYQLGGSLQEWEAQYNGRIDHAYGQHGKSPDVVREKDAMGVPVYRERETWFGGYPPITVQSADVIQRRGGTISMEGERRIRMNQVIDKAIQYGILYPKKESDGRYSYYIARFSPDVEWKKNIDRLPMDGNLYPEGRELVEATLAQNRMSLDEVSVKVALAEGGILDKTADTEDRALSRARTVLYSHMPMFIEMRTSIELMEDFFEEVAAENEKGKQGKFPAMFIKLIKGNVVYRDEDKCWKLRATRRGLRDEVIIKMDEDSIKRRRRRDPFYSALEEAGLSLYVIYKNFEELLEEDSWDIMMKMARENEKDAMDDELDEWDAITEELLAQRDTIEDYGADLDVPEELPRIFKKKMNELYEFSDEELVSIASFYKDIDGWRRIR